MCLPARKPGGDKTENPASRLQSGVAEEWLFASLLVNPGGVLLSHWPPEQYHRLQGA